MAISENNKLQHILDFDICKTLVEEEKARDPKTGDNVILCPLYSINIASKYEDGQALDDDLQELSEYIGEYVEVSQYDDLIVILTDGDDAYDPEANRD